MAASDQTVNPRAEACRRAADLLELESRRCTELGMEIRDLEADESQLREIAQTRKVPSAAAVILVKAERLRRLRALIEEELTLRNRIEQMHRDRMDLCIEIMIGRRP
jgi:hypothetical protein